MVHLEYSQQEILPTVYHLDHFVVVLILESLLSCNMHSGIIDVQPLVSRAWNASIGSQIYETFILMFPSSLTLQDITSIERIRGTQLMVQPYFCAAFNPPYIHRVLCITTGLSSPSSAS